MSFMFHCSRLFRSRVSLIFFSLFIVTAVFGLARFQAQPQPPGVTVVSAATFEEGPVALESIAAAFGRNFATTTAQANTLPLPTTLGGTRVTIRDSIGVERAAGLFFVSPAQVNFQVPAGLAVGAATITIINARNEATNGTLQIFAVAPGLFTANGNGQGVAAGFLLRAPQMGAQSFEPLAEFDARQQRFVPRPLKVNDSNLQTERLFLVLFGTGWRRRTNLNDVRAYIGGVETAVAFAGAQPGSAGLDQLNIPLDAALIAKLLGRGRLGVAISVAGFGSSNVVEIEVGGYRNFAPPQITGFEFAGGRSSALVGEIVRIKGSNFASVSPRDRVRIGTVEAPILGVSAIELIIGVPFGAVTAPVTISTTGGETRSRDLLPIRTSISGIVENTQRQPLPGMAVRLLADNGLPILTTRTTNEGIFVLPDVPVPNSPPTNRSSVIEIDGASLNVTPPFPQVRLSVPVQAGRDHLFPYPLRLQQAYGPEIKVPPPNSAAERAFNVPARAVTYADDWLPALHDNDADALHSDAAQNCGAAEAINLALPLDARVYISCSLTTPDCPYPTDRFYINQVEGSRTPVALPRGHFSSNIAQVAPFGLIFSPSATFTLANTDCLPPGAQVKLFGFPFDSFSVTGDLRNNSFRELGTGLVARDGRTISAIGGIGQGGLYFFSAQRLTSTVIGRVVAVVSGHSLFPELEPVANAMVTVRGQTVFTDGNGAFVLRDVPVLSANDRAALEVTFLRATGRVERALLADLSLTANQTRVVGDIVLSASNTNRPPVLIAAASLSAEEGKTTDFNFVATDADAGQTVMVNLSGAPLAALINRGNGQYTLRITPGLDDAGEHTLTLTATDPLGLVTTRRITLTVINTNQAPTALVQTVIIDEDTPKEIILTATDPDRDALRFIVVTGPQHGRLTGEAPDLRYTPEANYFGADSFTFKVSDGARASTTSTVTINVRPINDAPVLTVPGEQRVAPGQTLSFNIAAMDADPSDAVSFMMLNPPAGATLQPITSGSTFGARFTWTPAMAGVYVVNFKATDNGTPALSATAAVAITVGAPNQGAWTATAGPTGGTVTALLANGAQVFAGTAGNGVYRSNDGGATWQRIGKGLPRNAPVNALAAIGATLFAGTSFGVYRSTDQGGTWTEASQGLGDDNLFGRVVSALVAKGNLLFASVSNGLYFRPNGTVYVSADNGQSWRSAGLPNVGIDALTASSTAVFAAILNQGVYRSTDDGQSWTLINAGLPNFPRITALTASGTTIFANDDSSILFRSDNNGQNWTAIFTGIQPLSIRTLLVAGGNLLIGASDGVYVLPLSGQVALPLRPVLRSELVNALAISNDVVLAGIFRRGVFRSLDGGRNWTESNAGLTNVQVYALTTMGSSLFAATDAGVFVTSDQGQSWQTANNGLPLSVNTVTVNFPDRVIALVTDGANLYAGLAIAGVYRSRDQGRNWERVFDGMNRLSLQSLGLSGATILASFSTGVGEAQHFRSTDQGASWSPGGAGLPAAVTAYATLGAQLFAAAGDGVYVSTDNGTSWTAARRGLPERIGVISLLASGTRLYAGTAGRGVFVSNDGGQSWTAANGNLPTSGIILSLIANGTNILATVVELPASLCPGGVLIDGRCTGVVVPGPGAPLFSGPAYTYFGLPSRVFISPDNGQNWAPIMAGLSEVALTVLQSSGAQVFVGSYGDGVFARQF